MTSTFKTQYVCTRTLRGSLHALFHPRVKYFLFKCIFHPGVNSIHFHSGVKRSHVQNFFEKCDAKQFDFFYFSQKTKNVNGT